MRGCWLGRRGCGSPLPLLLLKLVLAVARRREPAPRGQRTSVPSGVADGGRPGASVPEVMVTFGTSSDEGVVVRPQLVLARVVEISAPPRQSLIALAASSFATSNCFRSRSCARDRGMLAGLSSDDAGPGCWIAGDSGREGGADFPSRRGFSVPGIRPKRGSGPPRGEKRAGKQHWGVKFDRNPNLDIGNHD